MNEFEDLTSRLKALGDNPVPPPVATQHLTAMAELSAGGGIAGAFGRKWRVAVAFGVGLLVGGSGLGYAAANEKLPDAAQNGIAKAAEQVGIDIPEAGETEAKEKAAKQRLTPTLPCDDFTNRGGFVSANVKAARAADQTGGASEIAKAAKDCDFPEKDAEETEAPEVEDGDEAKPEKDKGKENKPEDAGRPDDQGKPEDLPAGPAPDDADDAADDADDADNAADDADDAADSADEAEDEPQGPPSGTPGNAPEDTPAP